MYHIWCQSVEPFDSFPRHLNLWPPTPLPNTPGVLYLANVNSQMNPQTGTKVGANQSSRLTDSPDFWMFDPLKPRSAPLYLEWQFVWLYPFPDECEHVCQIRSQSVQPFDSFNILLNLWPLKTPKMPPGTLSGEMYLAYVYSQTNPQTCTKFGANRSSCLTDFPDFWICDPLKPPGVLSGELYLAYVHFQTNPKICTKFGANQSSRLRASPNIWICDPLPPEMTLGYCGANRI